MMSVMKGSTKIVSFNLTSRRTYVYISRQLLGPISNDCAPGFTTVFDDGVSLTKIERDWATYDTCIRMEWEEPWSVSENGDIWKRVQRLPDFVILKKCGKCKQTKKLKTYRSVEQTAAKSETSSLENLWTFKRRMKSRKTLHHYPLPKLSPWLLTSPCFLMYKNWEIK